MFIGEYNCTLDTSRRLIIPAALKKEFTAAIVMKGFEKCLYIFTNKEWGKLSEKVSGLSIAKTKNRKFIRALSSGAFECELDNKGRVCLNQKLLAYANLTKDCMLLGVGNHLEVWDLLEYEKYLQANADVLATLGEEVDI